ncbi:MAG: ribosome recycling factor [Myxococcaceae bacterium]|nr:ribosome recycling factor [Myxococcaceae bacterium]MCI0673958.1 ribosome recycling factor [Myxococcaceae bacterium]
MVDDVLNDLKERINRTLEDLKKDLSKVRTGRANISVLDGIRVDYYGTPTPLSGVANLAAPEPRLITIKPWDKGVLKDIERAIKEANIGLNPMNDGEMIRLPIPALTEERRKEIAKQVRTKGEDHKVAIRNVRRDSNELLKDLLKDKAITEDDHKRAQEKTQKETDGGVAKVDELIQKKEKEVMEV